MQDTPAKTRTLAALTVCIAAAALMTTHPALACPPEIKMDPTTGAALPQPDLQAALAELEALTVADTAR